MITTERNQFVGAHVTAEVKKALRSRAADERQSMSQVVQDALEKHLKPAPTADTPAEVTETTNA